jgi:hypothetical protein
LTVTGRYSGSAVAVIAAAIGSSVLTFLILILWGLPAVTWPEDPLQIAVFLSVVFLWGPAFALVPSAILGFLVERPLTRRLIAQEQGGFVEHLLAIVGAAVLLWLLLRVVVVLTGPQTNIMDYLSLAIFAIVGLCSALSWWFIVVLPARRA